MKGTIEHLIVGQQYMTIQLYLVGTIIQFECSMKNREHECHSRSVATQKPLQKKIDRQKFATTKYCKRRKIYHIFLYINDGTAYTHFNHHIKSK